MANSEHNFWISPVFVLEFAILVLNISTKMAFSQNTFAMHLGTNCTQMAFCQNTTYFKAAYFLSPHFAPSSGLLRFRGDIAEILCIDSTQQKGRRSCWNIYGQRPAGVDTETKGIHCRGSSLKTLSAPGTFRDRWGISDAIRGQH